MIQLKLHVFKIQGKFNMLPAHILIIDDDQTFRDLLKDVLEFEGFSVITSGSGKDGLDQLESDHFDLLLLDLVMPNMNGIQVLKKALSIKPELAIVMVSGQGTIEKAVKAVKMGAYDFIEKPVDAKRMLLTVRNTLEISFLKQEHNRKQQETINNYGMVGESNSMKQIFNLIDTIAPTNTAIFITGESGTGKELIVSSIHYHSKRTHQPLIHVNCAAIPETLIESELFGHEKGAFTDARTTKKGYFQLAHHGTLFLDEIGDLSLNAQAKILRALETGEIMRVGGQSYINVDIRLISATNKDIEQLIKQGSYREDLYYRVNVIPIHLPPLRKRPEDIIPLCEYFMKKTCESNNITCKELLSDAQLIIKNQPWQGNIRELKNFIQKLAVLVEPTLINARIITNLLKFPTIHTTTPTKETLKEARKAFEQSYITSTLEDNNWHISKTADILGIERSHLYRKMEQLGIEAE